MHSQLYSWALDHLLQERCNYIVVSSLDHINSCSGYYHQSRFRRQAWESQYGKKNCMHSQPPRTVSSLKSSSKRLLWQSPLYICQVSYKCYVKVLVVFLMASYSGGNKSDVCLVPSKDGENLEGFLHSMQQYVQYDNFCSKENNLAGFKSLIQVVLLEIPR